MASAGTPLAQQPTRTEPNDPSNTQIRNETTSPQHVNDNDTSQPPSIELFQQDLNDTNLFSVNKTQRSEEQDTSRPLDRTQDKEQYGQQNENVPKFQDNKTLSEKLQERNVIPTSIDQILMTNIFTSVRNDTEVQNDNSTQPQFETAN